MASIASPLGRLIRHLWVAVANNLTSWVTVGTIVALTGFGPDHWFAAALRYVEMPQAGLVWPTWLDIRAVIVSIGVAIVVTHVLVRRILREKAMVGAAAAPSPQPGQVTRILQATWRPAQRMRVRLPCPTRCPTGPRLWSSHSRT
jgi:hypothetical protein